MKSLAFAMLVLSISATSCKLRDSGADLKGGYTGDDCPSYLAEYKLQSSKMETIGTELSALILEKEPKQEAGESAAPLDNVAVADAPNDVSSFEDDIKDNVTNINSFSNTFPLQGSTPQSLESVVGKSFRNGSVTRLEDCDTKLSDSSAKGKCSDYYTIVERVNSVAAKYNNIRRKGGKCSAGAQSEVVPVLQGYCSRQCAFGTENCGMCEFDVLDGTKRSNHRLVCSTEDMARSTIDDFCSGKDFACNIGGCETKPGNDFVNSTGTAASGMTRQTEGVDFSGFLGAYGSVKVVAGVVSDNSVVAKGTLGGELSALSVNSANSIYFDDGRIKPGTDVYCQMSISQVGSISFATKNGVGGAFKLFGNGAEASAGVAAGGTLSIGNKIVRRSSAFPAGGLTKDEVGLNCKQNLKVWMQNDIPTIFKNEARFVIKAIESAGSFEQPDPLRGASAAFSGTQKGTKLYDQNDPYIGFHPYCNSSDPGRRVRTGDSYYVSLRGSNDCNQATELLWNGKQKFKTKPWYDKSKYSSKCVHELYRRCNSDWL